MIALLAGFLLSGHPAADSLPHVDSETVQRIAADPWTLWYDETNMPRAMQFGANAEDTHVHDGYHHFNDIDPTTNANLEYPWKDGGGLHRVPRSEVQVIKFFWHPTHKPVVVYRSVRSSIFYRQRAYDWLFPVDAVVGEILALRRNGYTYPFEIRMLTRETDAWHVQTLRQFTSKDDLADEIERLGYVALAADVRQLPVERRRVYDALHNRAAFVSVYNETRLPEFPEEVVEHLLQAPLLEVEDPTTLTSATTQIVPANYRGNHVGVTREDCIRCHEHVAKHVNHFDRIGRDWYGYGRGSDRIFSFHPFARQSIATNGGNWPVRLNPELLASGHIAEFRGQEGYVRLPQ